MFFYLQRCGPILIVIGLVSVAAGALVVIAWQRLRRAHWNHAGLLQELAELLQKRDWFEAHRTLEPVQHPFVEPWRTGLLLLMEAKHELHDIEEAISIEGTKLVNQLESSLKPLGAMITILPMLGFLGTIFGLISSFQHWESLGAQVSISVLAGGIYQAMITTAAGLLAAIPYYLIYHLLVAQTQRAALEFSRETSRFIRWIKEGLSAHATVEAEEALTPSS